MLYPKTENLLARGEDHIVLPELRRKEFGLVRYWHVTEKVDGMNIRIRLNLIGDYAVFGRSDNAQIPGRLREAIDERMFLWRDRFNPWDGMLGDDEPVAYWLFGEGYGPGIQRGGNLVGGDRPDFVLFDVAVERPEEGLSNLRTSFLDFESVIDIGAKLELPVVPVLHGAAYLEEVIRLAVGDSPIAGRNGSAEIPDREGVVITTQPGLLDRFGQRIKAKVKASDVLAAGGPDALIESLFPF